VAEGSNEPVAVLGSNAGNPIFSGAGNDWQAPCSVVFALEQCSSAMVYVAIVRHIPVGDAKSPETVVWIGRYNDQHSAALRRDWLMRHPDRCTYFGRHAQVLDPVETTAEIDRGVQADLARIERERCRAEQAAAAASAEAERNRLAHLRIESFLDDRDGWFSINLKRGSQKEPFWIARFRERWERERFRNWFRCQSHRFAELADFLTTNDSIELERLLLREMLESERRVKKTGLGSGGWRPEAAPLLAGRRVMPVRDLQETPSWVEAEERSLCMQVARSWTDEPLPLGLGAPLRLLGDASSSIDHILGGLVLDWVPHLQGVGRFRIHRSYDVVVRDVSSRPRSIRKFLLRGWRGESA
jgi:hypothetical protein